MFQEHISDKKEIASKLKEGSLFEGTIRFNPKFRQRAFLTIDELKVDVMIEGQTKMNRSLDGDKVLVQLDPVNSWELLKDKHSQKLEESKGKKPESNKKGYSNNEAVERRDLDEEEQVEEVKVAEPQGASLVEEKDESEE